MDNLRIEIIFRKQVLSRLLRKKEEDAISERINPRPSLKSKDVSGTKQGSFLKFLRKSKIDISV